MEPITRISIPTKNRPQQLIRLVTSLAEHQTPHAFTVSVFDQSPSSTAEHVATQLATVATETGTTIEYWTHADVAEYIDALAAGSGIEAAWLKRAFLPTDDGISTGMNRNLSLLRHTGVPHAMLDDDIEPAFLSPAPVKPPAETDTLPCTITPHLDRASALKGEPLMATYPLEPLQEPLQHLSNTLMQATGDVSPAFHLASLEKRVVMISPGVAGDTPIRRSYTDLIAPDPTHALFADGADGYEALQFSPYVHIAATQPTLTTNPFCVTYCALFPSSKQLPPFPPTGRSQDTIFGYLLWQLYPDWQRLHMPYVMPHHRDSVPPVPAPHTLDTFYTSNVYLMAVLQDSLVYQGVAPTLPALGQHLQHLGCTSAHDSVMLARELLANDLFAAGEQLQGWVATQPAVPEAWYRHIEQLIAHNQSLQQAIPDWQPDPTLVAAVQQRQRDYGHLLERWEVLNAAAHVINPDF